MPSKKSSLCEPSNFNLLFNNHFEAARNYIYYKCGNIEQAEDIAQDAFIKLWDRCAKIIMETAKNYLYSICNNALLNQYEHKRVVLRHQKSNPNSDTHIENPEYLLEMDEFKIKLESAINQLSIKEREVFLLSRIDKKTYKEISEITGITVKAVERRMSIAFVKLRTLLGKNLKV